MAPARRRLRARPLPMALRLSFAGLRLIGRVAAVPRPAASPRCVAHLLAPRPAFAAGPLPHLHLHPSRRRAPLCVAAKGGKEEADDVEPRASKKKEPVVLPAKLPAGARTALAWRMALPG